MDQLMIQYTVRCDQVQQNIDLLRAAYAELRADPPDDLRWITYQLDDGVTFIDIVAGSGDPAELAQRPAFHRFRSTLDDRCQAPPTMTELKQIEALGHP